MINGSSISRRGTEKESMRALTDQLYIESIHDRESIRDRRISEVHNRYRKDEKAVNGSS